MIDQQLNHLVDVLRRMPPARLGASAAVVSMVMVQLGVAASVGFFDRIGPGGTAWLRLIWAAVIFLVIARPWRASWTRTNLLTCVALGVVTAVLTLSFLQAVARIPLGTASALEFLGPLTIAVVRGRGTARVWAVAAAAGVVLMTGPWASSADPVGVGFALVAAMCWGSYILLTQRAGDAVAGVQALAISMPVAAVVATAIVGPSTFGGLSWSVMVSGIGLALLMPVIPFTLELLALRRLKTAAFGILMSVEPAIALLIGLVLLGQVPQFTAALGVLLVVSAGVGAERAGARDEGGKSANSATVDESDLIDHVVR